MQAWLQMPTSVSPGREVVSAVRLAWGIAKGALAALALAAAFCAAPPAPATAQEKERPSADVPGRRIIRTQRLRVPSDLFERDAVSFKRARVDAGGTVRADGHNLDLYGMVLIRRDRICASPEGARRGQRAFMAMRQLWKDNPSVAALWPPRARRKQCAGSDFNGNVVVANG